MPQPDPTIDNENHDDVLEDGDTFPREYVEKLRTESAGHRTAAKESREALDAATALHLPLQTRLHAALVAGSGRLADPTDLPFDVAHLEDDAAMTAAIDALLAAKPHLASRRVKDDIGQGAGVPKTEVSLAGMLAGRA